MLDEVVRNVENSKLFQRSDWNIWNFGKNVVGEEKLDAKMWLTLSCLLLKKTRPRAKPYAI